MMQILNKIFIENGNRPHFRRLLFWNKKGRAPILLVNGQERATVSSMKKGLEKRGQAPFFPDLPRACRLLDLTKIRG